MTPLIIFDCDGVLVDSETISNEVTTQLLNELGWNISFEETVERFMGRRMDECLTLMQTHLKRPLPADFVQRMNTLRNERFQTELKPVAGIQTVLESLDATSFMTCVASSGQHEKMRLTLSLTGLWSYFEGRIFSASEVARGKPYPDLFLYASEQMGVPVKHCVVIEDSLAGVQAASAAGMQVLAYAAHSSADGVAKLTASGATAFHDMHELPDLLTTFRTTTQKA